MVFQETNIFVDSGFIGEPAGINLFEIRKSQIPEPATLPLIGVGLASVGLLRRRRKAVNFAP